MNLNQEIEHELILQSLFNPHTLVATDIDINMYMDSWQVITGTITIPNQEFTVEMDYFYKSGGVYEQGGQIDTTWESHDYEFLELKIYDENDDFEMIDLTEEQEKQVFNLIINNQ